MNMTVRSARAAAFAACLLAPLAALAAPVHPYERVELVFTATGKYANPYSDVEMWVDLKGPGFSKRCYGFWDGAQTFRVRVTSTAPGEWTWTSGSSPADAGLAGKCGNFTSIAWAEAEKQQNPNRRGFPRTTANGHALECPDGTPYFAISDFFYPASTYAYEDLVSMFVEQKVVVTEMAAVHVPVRILCLEVECKYIGQQAPQMFRDFIDPFRFQGSTQRCFV